jgi:hypothetical protein
MEIAQQLLELGGFCWRFSPVCTSPEELAQGDFWRGQIGGLALFRSSDLLTHYRMPMRCPELAVVADSFHVRPLLHFLQSIGTFMC